MDDVTTNVARAAREDFCAAFATMAQHAATIPKWCDSRHPVGAAYQAAFYVLQFDFPRGRNQGLVPAAVLVRDSVEAVWRERDEARRIDHPDAPTDLAIMSGLWVDHRSIREVAKDLGRDEKGVRKRITATVAALDRTLADVCGPTRMEGPHFPSFTQNTFPIGESDIFEKRRKPQPRGRPVKRDLQHPWQTKPRVEVRAEMDELVAHYIAAGGKVRIGKPGRTRDYAKARREFHLTSDAARLPSGQAHLRHYRQDTTGMAPTSEAPDVPAKKLPGKAIQDEPRIGHAKSHREEVERLYHGAGFDPVRYGEQQSDKEQVDELVNRFFDASDEERERERAEQEKELRHKTMDTPPSGRARFKRALWATEFLKRDRAHVRQKKIAEEEDIRWQRAQWVKELLKQKRAEQAQKQEEEDYAREQKNRARSKKLKREATEWLKQRDRSTSRREE